MSIVQQLYSPRKADRVLLISMLGSGGLSVGEVRSTESNWARRTGKGVVFYKENLYSRTSSVPCHVTPHISQGGKKKALDPVQDG